jgi:hypothetical protein
MPSLIQDLIAQAAGAPQVSKNISPIADAKRQQVEGATARKREMMGAGVASAYDIALSGNQQAGVLDRTELENDLRDMPTPLLYEKYGDKANDMMLQRAAGVRELSADQRQISRSTGDLVQDSATDFGLAALNAAGGMGAAALSAATPDAETGIPNNMLELLGAAANKGADLAAMVTGEEPTEGGITSLAGTRVAQLLDQATKAGQATQSDQLNTLRGVQEATTALTDRDSDILYTRDIEAGKDSTVAGLSKVGRDAINAIDTATDDTAIVGSGTVGALGSLAVSIPTGGVIRSGVEKTLGTVGKLAKIGKAISAPAAIGAVEGGGAYTGAVNEVMNRSPEELMATSSDFRALVESGIDPLVAQRQLADDAGQKTAAIVAPVAGLIGAAVSPIGGGTLGNAILKAPSSLIREPLEEGLQGGAGQLVQNAVIQQDVDANQELTEGVGRQTGEGALYGLGMTAALSGAKAPALAVKGAGVILSPLARAAGSLLEGRAAKVQAENDLASPVADAKIAEQAAAVEANRPATAATVAESIAQMDATPEEKDAAQVYVDRVMSASSFDVAELADHPLATPELTEALAGVTSRVQAIQIMANIVNSAEEDSELQQATAYLMNEQFSPIEQAFDSNAEELAKLPEGDAVRNIVGEYDSLMQGVGQSPAVMAALGKIVNRQAAADAAAITAQSLATPAGQLQAQATIAQAGLNPEKGDLGASEAVLYQAAQGNLRLTASQKDALVTSVNILRAVQVANEQAKLNGEADPVSLNITTETSAGKVSVLEHSNNVRDAMRMGKPADADTYLTELRNFAGSMNNKMQALADSMTSLKGEKYQTVRNGQWFTATAPVQLRAGSLGSVKFAQKVYREARLVVDVFNGLADAYPALGAVKMPYPALPAELNMPAQAVVNNFSGVQAPATPTIKATAPAKTPTPIPAAPAPVTLKVATMTDEQLGRHLGRIQDLIAKGDKTEATAARFALLDAELNKREDAAYQAQVVQDRQDQADYEASLSATAPVKQAPVVKAPAPVAKPAPVIVENTTGIDDEKLADLEAQAAERGRETEPEYVEPTDGKGLSAVFERLLGGAKNLFLSAYKLPKEALTRTIGSESPLADITDALRTQSTLSAFMGKVGSRKLSDEVGKAYADYLTNAPEIMTVLQESLDAYVTKNAADLKSGKALSWVTGKATNIAEEVEGKIVYNQSLLETATLAAMQWFLTADNYRSDMEYKDVASITGLPVESITPQMLAEYSEGVGLREAKRSMGALIRRFWGVTKVADAAIGRVEGIPEALAAELIYALDKAGFVEVKFLNSGIKKHYRIVPSVLPADSPLTAFPNAIEEAVMITPEAEFFIGSAPAEISPTQLRRPNVKITEQQRAAVTEAQATKHYLDLPMLSFYSALGLDKVKVLFGAGGETAGAKNVNHAKSLEGKDRAAISAYRTLMNMAEQVMFAAKEAGVAFNKMPIHFAYDFTSVNRMQMRGSNSPTANKFVREAVLPTGSILDLSQENNVHNQNYRLALGQALGLKVHKLFIGDTVAKVDAMLAGDLKPTVDALTQWHQTSFDANNPMASEEISDSLFEMIQRDFKVAEIDLSAVALHAVMDYARLQATADKSAYETNLYVEADGVSNGPINAMMLFFGGVFNANWIKNVARGGVSLGNATNLAEQYKRDPKDLYEVTADGTQTGMADLRDHLKAKAPKVYVQMQHLLTLMDMVFGKDLSFQDGVLTIKRGLTKNPLTITIYGSGAAGIAQNLTSAMTEALYEKMSSVAEGKTGDVNMDMFGDQAATPEHASKMMGDFVNAWEALTNKKVFTFQDEYKIKAEPSGVRAGAIDPVTFTVTSKQMENLNSAMLELFVGPLRSSVTAVVGSPVFHTTELLQKGIQLQSIVLAHFFKGAVKSKVDEKRAEAAAQVAKGEEPTWKPTDFLTQPELDAIHKSLEHMAPFIKTPTQTWYVAGGERADVANVAFSQALNGSFSTEGFVFAPADAGVSGTPFLNIGAGDGQAIQNVLVAPGVSSKILTIYDGIHLALDEIQSMGRLVNEAVHASWQGNPMEAVHQSFATFMADTDLSNMEPELVKELATVLFNKKAAGGVSTELLLMEMRNMQESMLRTSQTLQGRINTLAQVNMSADQMAATGVPFNTTGLLDLSGLEPEQQANELNALLVNEISKLRADAPLENLASSYVQHGVEHASGARVLGTSDLKQLHSIVNLPHDQQNVFRRIMARMAVDGFKVVHGTAQQLADYQLDTQGKPLDLAKGDISGYTDMANKTVFLISPSSETLVHELIHASTFAKVLQHYISKGKSSIEVAGAVTRLEALMNQFLSLESQALVMSDDARIAFINAREAIQGHLANNNAGGKAAGLNEFMAWAGSNAHLARLAKRQAATKLGRIAEAVLQTIKALFGIGLEGKDLFANLVFNTEIIMAAAAPLSSRVAEMTLYQSSAFGNSDRLVEVAKTFNHYISNFLDTPPALGKLDAQASVLNALALSKEVGDSFAAARFFQSEQEMSTFNAITTALATEAQLDGNVMAIAQKMYAHVAKLLTVEHFMPTVTNNPDRDYYYALQKFNAIMGKAHVGTDTLGRSTLMPAFLALATVNDEFRAILAAMELPKAALKGWNTLDGIIENVGNMGMESLSARLSGVGRNSTTVEAAIDSLNRRLLDLASEQENRIDQLQQQAGGMLDRANQAVVDRVGSMAKALLARSTEASANATNKVTKRIANFGMGVSAIFTDETGQQVSEAVMLSANNTEIWSGFRDLIGDVVGRTVSNMNVYDMIKRVRSGVQNLRQQYREHLPKLLADKYSRVLTKEEWASAYNGMAKTDIAALVGNGFTAEEVLELMADSKKMAKAISKLETSLQNSDPDNFSDVQQKMDQLAHYMSTGEVGVSLLRNATAIAQQAGDKKSAGFKARDAAFTKQIDLLVSMYAFENQSAEDKAVMTELVATEKDGLSFTVSYMVGQRAGELSKQIEGVGHINHYKGFLGSAVEAGANMIIADDSDFSKLRAKSYVRVADYKGSVLEGKRNRGYYYSASASRAGFEQGIFQNVRHTVSGVDSVTGFSVTGTAGVITDPVQVARITKNIAQDTRGEALMPLFNANGEVYAYERSLDPTEMARIAAPNHLAKAIGQWRGRQVEESAAQQVNEELIGNLKAMYDADVAKGSLYTGQYVNLKDLKSLDPVVKDALSLLNNQTWQTIQDTFGEEFMVRRDLLNDVLGYRGASVGDAWSGNTRWSKGTQEAIYNIALSVFGNDAYKYLTNAESFVQSAVSDAKVLIVVKSVIVPMTNLIANMFQLVGRGVPLRNVVKGYGSKVMEIDSYAKSRIRQIEVEAELRAATGKVIQTNKLNAELKSIVDGHRRLSIWPLIEAGEFSSVSDVGLTRDEIMLTEGRLAQYIEAQVDKLPPGLATVGKNLLVTKDTALFQGLQRSVEYGDMIAKAILYDDLTTRGKKSQAEALGRITEEFVNYDRLPGRFRGAMENIGLLWFYNFKIRITKQAISMIRNNPLHVLLAMAIPAPSMFGSIGTPITDNLATKLLEDSLGGSIGPTQGLTAINLNPWLNLVQ